MKEEREEVRTEEKKGKGTVVITPHTKTSELLWKRIYVSDKHFLRSAPVIKVNDIFQLLQISHYRCLILTFSVYT